MFFTFTWGGGRGQRGGQGSRAARGPQDAKPKGKGRGPKGGPKGDRQKASAEPPRRAESRPPRKEKAIDPDNPFAAALMGLKGGK